MADPWVFALAVTLLAVGLGMLGCAGYLQHVSLPEERTPARRGMRAALAMGGLGLLVLGSWLLA